MAFSRRAILKALPLIGIAPAAASDDLGKWLADPETMTVEQRRDFHLAEYQKAVAEIDPAVDRWSVADRGKTIVITAHRVTGRYMGDDFYDIRTSVGTLQVDFVRLRPDRIDGHRTFDLIRWPGVGKRYAIVTEPALMDVIGAPHSGGFGSYA